MSENKFYKILRPILWVLTVALATIVVVRAIAPRREARVDVNSYDSDWSKLMLVLESVDKNYVDKIDHKKVI